MIIDFKPGDMFYVVYSNEFSDKENVLVQTIIVASVGPKTLTLKPHMCGAIGYRVRIDRNEINKTLFITPDEALTNFVERKLKENERLQAKIIKNQQMIVTATSMLTNKA